MTVNELIAHLENVRDKHYRGDCTVWVELQATAMNRVSAQNVRAHRAHWVDYSTGSDVLIIVA